jgi:hypothetical protein
LNARRVSRSKIAQDIDLNRRAADALGLRLGNFAYPYGQVSLRHKAFVGSLYQTARSNIAGINGTSVDASCLLAMSLSPFSDLRAIRKSIDHVAEHGGWLILYTHDVSPEPTAGGISPAGLNELVAAALRSGAETINVAEVVRRAGRWGVASPASRPFADRRPAMSDSA